MKPKIIVLRLGHRKERDKRISTHVGLTARALGASRIIYSGEDDPGLVASVNGVAKNWGGSFKASYTADWLSVIQRFKGLKIHLTFYGEPLEEKIKEIRVSKNLLVIVGAGKVPADAYKLADCNVAVTNQPHSEVAALAVFLHEYYRGRELGARFQKARRKITPSAKGKSVFKSKKTRGRV